MELEYKQGLGRIEPFFMEMHLEQFHRKQLLLGTTAIAERTIFSFVTTTTKCLAPASHPLSLGCQGNFPPTELSVSIIQYFPLILQIKNQQNGHHNPFTNKNPRASVMCT